MYKLLQTFRIGVYSLLLHKLRAVLAVLGIFIGITAVIWLVAVGEGVSNHAQRQIEELGATNIMIRSVKPAQNSSNSGSAMFVSYGLLRDDYKRFRSNIPMIQNAVPMREIRQEVRYDDRATECRLVGCTPEFFALNRLDLARGRLLTDRDGSPPDNVCVIADGAARELFGFQDPLGRSIQIGSDFYTVVGRTKYRTPSSAIGGSMSGQDFNLDVYIPIETLKIRIGDMVFLSRSGSREGEIVELSQITVSVPTIREVDETADMIRSLLQKYHENEDYAVNVPIELLRQAELMRYMLNSLCIVIAGISLLVGGIGIMNIMLATVTERTREIGIRRALGATQGDIIQQFLIEAVVLTAVGGTIGVLFGFLCGPAIAGLRTLLLTFSPDLLSRLPTNVNDFLMELKPEIAPWSILASLVISIGVGIMAGMYPAFRAAKMDPIEALRHE